MSAAPKISKTPRWDSGRSIAESHFRGLQGESQVQKSPQLTTEGNSVTSIEQLTTVSSLEVDYIYGTMPDLVNDKFRPWYCKQFSRLGRETVLRLAGTARSDSKTNPRGYFSVLLKRA